MKAGPDRTLTGEMTELLPDTDPPDAGQPAEPLTGYFKGNYRDPTEGVPKLVKPVMDIAAKGITAARATFTVYFAGMCLKFTAELPVLEDPRLKNERIWDQKRGETAAQAAQVQCKRLVRYALEELKRDHGG